MCQQLVSAVDPEYWYFCMIETSRNNYLPPIERIVQLWKDMLNTVRRLTILYTMCRSRNLAARSSVCEHLDLAIWLPRDSLLCFFSMYLSLRYLFLSVCVFHLTCKRHGGQVGGGGLFYYHKIRNNLIHRTSTQSTAVEQVQSAASSAFVWRRNYHYSAVTPEDTSAPTSQLRRTAAVKGTNKDVGGKHTTVRSTSASPEATCRSSCTMRSQLRWTSRNEIHR